MNYLTWAARGNVLLASVVTLVAALIPLSTSATEFVANTILPTTLGGKTLWMDVTERNGAAPYQAAGQGYRVALVATGSTNGTFTMTPGGFTGTWSAAFSGAGSSQQPGNYLRVNFINLVGDGAADSFEFGYTAGTTIPTFYFMWRGNAVFPVDNPDNQRGTLRVTDGTTPTAIAPTFNYLLGVTTLYTGSSPQITASVSGTFPLAYQWSKGGSPIANATNAQIIFTNIQLSDAGNYTLLVTNAAGSASTNFTLSVSQSALPTITSQPASITVLSNQNFSLTVGATGTLPITYQWHKDGAPLATNASIFGITNAQLTIFDARGSDQGSYTVVLSNYAGTVTSAVAVVTVQLTTAPLIVTQPPAYLNILTNTTFSISAVVTSTPPPSLQWQRGGVNLTGETNATLNRRDTNYNANGNYRLLAANAYGSVTSIVCVVSAYDTNVFFGSPSPTNVTLPTGGTMRQRVFAYALPPVNFTLRKNGVNVPGYIALTSTYDPVIFYSVADIVVPDMQPLDSGSYTLVASNLYGGRNTSVVFTVNVQATSAPVVLQHPASVSAFLSTSGTIVTNGVKWSSIYPVTVQWYSNNFPISGQVSSNLTLGFNSVQQFNLSVVLSNQVGLTTSEVAQVSLTLAPGALDTNFVSIGVFNNQVNAVAALTNGGVLAGGAFTTIGASNRNYLVEMNSNGVITAWLAHTNGFNGTVYALHRYADGRVLVGGAFTNLGSATQYSGLARLNADGMLDLTFLGGSTNGTRYVDNAVFALAVRESDGAIAIGGMFTNVAGQAQRGVALLDGNGVFQSAFRPVATNATFTYSFGIRALAFQPDGKLLIGGAFSSVNGTARVNIARLNTDGTTDTNFTTTLAANSAPVQALLVQPDGRICLAGTFSMVNGQSRSTFARVLANGTLDSPVSGVSGGTFLTRQSGGNLIFGGSSALGRILTNDTVDAFFPGRGFGTPSGFPGVQAAAFAPDGGLWIGGSFTAVGLKNPQYNLARLLMEPPVVAAPTFGTPFLVSGSVQLQFPTVSSRSYQIQWKTNLSAPTWDVYQAISGDGTTRTVLIPVTAGSAAFFRVTLLP